MLKLMLITNNPRVARFAVSCGVERIFVDLEVIGKKARQGHLDTWISGHGIEDVALIRAAIPQAELLVRLNPVNDDTPTEIDAAITAGADMLMLPMITSVRELVKFCEWTAERVGVVPLIETPQAQEALPDLIRVPGVSEIYIGLNDLHLGLRMDFIFEPLANGMVDEMAAAILQVGLPFGFGGIARMGEGLLPAEKILGEHLRLGSSRVILSRTFHRDDGGGEMLMNEIFRTEVAKLREAEAVLLHRSPEQIEADRQEVVRLVRQIAAARRAARTG